MKQHLPVYLLALRRVVEPVDGVRYSLWLAVVFILLAVGLSANHVYGDCYGVGEICLLTPQSDAFSTFSAVAVAAPDFSALDAEYVRRTKQAFVLSLLIVMASTIALTTVLFVVFKFGQARLQTPLKIVHGPVNWMVHFPLMVFAALVVSTYAVPDSGCAVYKSCEGHRYYVGKIVFFMALAIFVVVPPLGNSLLKFLCANFVVPGITRSDP